MLDVIKSERSICIIGTRSPAASSLARTLYADQKTYLVELLIKQDQMSMAASVRAACRFSIISWWSSPPEFPIG